MNKLKALTIAITMGTVCYGGNALAFDKSFHPNHQFVDQNSIGPNFETGYILDKEKAEQTKTAEEEMQLPSEVVPSDPTPKNSNIPDGAERRLIPSI
ncbi:hypothetical protein [Nitrosomonas ureae]|uniref:Uncharacterized protein n=1 Tax=Nitrosomonas ureae TaxID=44577 RepID=A0A1H5XIL3_9PROT|nr:hypothetical protein [Nitrosomonas ureae]SEG11562.1 hypothetical protein SAMN05216334_12814 [Nitrosomonas ureae]